MKESLEEDALGRELDFARALVLDARFHVLQLGPQTQSLLLPVFLLSQGWERVLKSTLLLREAFEETEGGHWSPKSYGHDIEALVADFVERCCRPADTPEMRRAVEVWTEEGEWLLKSINEYAKGSRYHGLDHAARALGVSRNDDELDRKEDDLDGHPEEQWLDFYTNQQMMHGLSTEEEVDDLDPRPAFGRINVRISSLIEDQLQAVVDIFDSGRLGGLGERLAHHLRFARWTSVDF